MALTNLLKKLSGGRENGVVEGKMCRTHSTESTHQGTFKAQSGHSLGIAGKFH